MNKIFIYDSSIILTNLVHADESFDHQTFKFQKVYSNHYIPLSFTN